MTPTVSITWTYTSDPLVLAALGGFNVYALDASGQRIAPPLAVPKTAPYAARIAVPGYAAQAVEVVPYDSNGAESINRKDAPVYVQLPPGIVVSQVVG